VAFNSWGQKDFWARAIQTDNSAEYSNQIVTSQIPDGGAYVVLIRIYAPVTPGSDTPPEYSLSDLSGLIKLHDWRENSDQGAQSFEFYKWARYLSLGIACSPNASDAIVSSLNNLLQSWKFDAIPVGDPEWAGTQARLLLPPKVGPLLFDIRSSSRLAPGNLERSTEAEVRGTTVHFRFTYIWNYVSVTIPSFTPAGSSHWWEIDVLPTGKAVLTGEGGAPLP
jgi:hypothetical protein